MIAKMKFYYWIIKKLKKNTSKSGLNVRITEKLNVCRHDAIFDTVTPRDDVEYMAAGRDCDYTHAYYAVEDIVKFRPPTATTCHGVATSAQSKLKCLYTALQKYFPT